LAIVYVSLGSNLGDKKDNLLKACILINSELGIIVQKSSFYETKPWGFTSFNNFLNRVIEFETNLNPSKLLAALLSIEEKMGRKRSHDTHYQDRIIDLDILFYDDEIINAANLVIPHPRLHLRKFVLAPLAEINSDLMHPVLRKKVGLLLKELAYG
jgi:2-amino-4-hydroxy-6-hydroxymethyldihydropteridine diphosphokinase